MQLCRAAGRGTLRTFRASIHDNADLNIPTASMANPYVKGPIQNAGPASFNSGNVQSANVN